MPRRSTLSVLVVSTGRSTLARTIGGLAAQLRPGDELLVDVNDDSPAGHRARQRLMERARGDYMVFSDDDDLWTKDALSVVRKQCRKAKPALHIFRMILRERGPRLGVVMWARPEIYEGNVSTQMLVVPNVPEGLGRWSDRYEGDYDFAVSTAANLDVVWHEEVVVARNAATVHLDASTFTVDRVIPVGATRGIV